MHFNTFQKPSHPSPSEEGVSQSRFHMWRCVVALAHADGVVKKEERDYLRDVFENMSLSNQQYQTLLEDLKTPQNINDFFKYVEEPGQRSQLIYFARILAYKDGEFHPNEQILLEKLNIKVTDNIDVESVSRDVEKYVSDKMKDHGVHLNDNPALQIFETFTHWIGLDKG